MANAKLLAGSATCLITPPLGLTIQAATHQNKARFVRDELEANALYLTDGTGRVVLVSCDVVCMEPDTVQAILAEAAARSGLAADDIILTCTHTHGGPVMMPSNRYNAPDPAYHARLRDLLADLVAQAVQSAVPAAVGWGRGEAVLGYNRRLCFADGSHTMHGNTRRPDFTGLEGVRDNGHVGLFVRSLDNRLLAVAANNTSHPTTFYGRDCFSADFPGQARALLRQVLGPALPVLFLNGAQGDICNENMTAAEPRGETTDQKVMRLGCLAAGETLRLLHEAEFRDTAVIRHAVSRLSATVRLPDPERLAWAKPILEKADKEGKTVDFNVLFAHGATLLQERFGAHPVDVLPLHAVRIGDLAFATLPGEFYCEFGLEIKRRSPAPLTGVIGLANGNHGYCPTMQGIIGGGYSGEAIYWTRLAPDTGYRVVDEACRLLHQLDWPASARPVSQ